MQFICGAAIDAFLAHLPRFGHEIYLGFDADCCRVSTIHFSRRGGYGG
jgi:hypothetical protein